jgi:hypothetical protein
MSNIDNLQEAKETKYDEFYTQYEEIQKEINAYLEFNPDTFKNKTIFCPCDDPEWSNFTRFFAQNFENLKLKKLISTSYSAESKSKKYNRKLEFYHQITLFETNSPSYDVDKTDLHGKLFILDKDTNNSGKIDIEDLEWSYLDGDGDFRSDEIKKLRDEADIIVTNPPFSLYRDFVAWIFEAKKDFIIIGQQNSITYKEIFPLLKNNEMWSGATSSNSDMVFAVPKDYDIAPKDREKAAKLGYVGNYTRMGNTCWFTNIEHGRRHQFLEMMTMADNIKFSKHKDIKEYGYLKYDNLDDAIDVPYVDAIPSDYDGIMGVPASMLYRFNPEQFELVGVGTGNRAKEIGVRKNYRGRTDIAITYPDGTHKCPFGRVLIRKIKRS